MHPVRRTRYLSAGIFAAAWIFLLCFYRWHAAASHTVYVNDDALYYYQQLQLMQVLPEGSGATLRHVWASIGTDYTAIPNLLLAPLFSLTDWSINGFSLAAALMTWTPLMCQLHRLTQRLAERLGLHGGRTLLLCAGVCVSVCCVPLLHRAAAWRQINLLGLPLLTAAVELSWRMDWRRPSPWRLLALFLSMVMLALMRRWFLLFIAGWLLAWGIPTTLRIVFRRDWRALRSLLLYGLFCTAAGAAILWPMLSRALQGNYAVAYSYWRKEGSALLYELRNQSWLLGRGTCGLIAAGYVWALLQRRSPGVRRLAGTMLGCWAVSILLFTRIQNMTYHQATILMPAYVLGLTFFFAMLAACSRRILRWSGVALACLALALQWGVSLTHQEPQRLSPLLSHVSLKPPVREDLAQISTVSDFVAETCTADHPALFLLNSADYDRLTFVTLRYPDLSLREKVALDRTALPSDGFPRAWFSARYILVPTTPQTGQPGGVIDKLTRYLLTDAADRFEVAAIFPFGSFDLLAMERTGPVEYAEVEELMALFAAEHAQYPKVYGDRIGFFYDLAINP